MSKVIKAEDKFERLTKEVNLLQAALAMAEALRIVRSVLKNEPTVTTMHRAVLLETIKEALSVYEMASR